MLRAWLVRVGGLFGKKRREQELEAELESHLAMHIEDNRRAGMRPEEARRQALVKLGGLEQTKEIYRDRRSLPFLETFFQDIRYGLRQLRRSPGFTAVAILTLALGIGANTAIFSVVEAVLLRPLPYKNPGQLVTVFQAKEKRGIAAAAFSYPVFTALRKQQRVFSEMAGTNAHDLTLTGWGEPAIVHTIVTTPEIFSLLGARPLAGRIFGAKDGLRGGPPVVLLSENLWRSHFGADPNLIGKTINLDMRPFTVAGIMPAKFQYPVRSEGEDVWMPAGQDPLFSTFMPVPDLRWLVTVARLRAGVSLREARATMEVEAARLEKEFPEANAGFTIRVEPLQEQIVGGAKSPLLILLGAVGLVLLMGCANVANLLLARSTARMREIAMRQALGAGRGRLVRQLLTESALLGLAGGAAGMVVAVWGVQSLKSLLPPGLPRAETIGLDGGVMIFALALSLAASLIFGLAPAYSAVRWGHRAGLDEGAWRSGESRARRRARELLVAAEMALAVIVLVAAGLLIRTLAAITSVHPGFNPQHVVAAEISLPRFVYSRPQQWTEFANESLERIKGQPGLAEAAFAVPLPIAQNSVDLRFDLPGHPPLAQGEIRSAHYAAVSPGYFRVMQIPLVRGRVFSEGDQPSKAPVVVISQDFARRYFSGRDPLGQKLALGFPPNGFLPREIVGVVGDVRDVALKQRPGPMMYVPFAQAPFWGGDVVVRTSLDPAIVANSIRRVVREIDKNLPVTDITRLPEAMDSQASVAQPRFRTLLLGLFAALALVLAAVGIFGVTAYSVSRRTQEIGVRMALGAERRDVLKLVVGQGLKLTIVGLAIGIVGALALTRFLSSLLYGVTPTDPLTFVAVALILVCVALLACYIPARRATKVDPMVALRYE